MNDSLDIPNSASSNPVSESVSPGRPGLKGASVLAVLGVLTYATSLNCPFIFDDRDFILQNESIYRLWPPWPALFAAKNVSRPLIGLSTAINYAISGASPWSYHLFNLLVHICAALALFGIARRTLLTEGLKKRFGNHSTALALTIASIWLVHPLQTAAVTYLIQRCESLIGMFYL
ncbi:MAG: hypothetical protein ACREDR_48705, partial [Blastocatellia bacterium]